VTSPRPSVAAILTHTAMLWLAVALTLPALWPIYQTPWLFVVVGGALLGGTLVALAGTLLRLNAAVVALATVAVFALVGVPLAVPSHAESGLLPTLDGLLDLFAAVALGWKQLLTISLPVGTFEALFVPFFALILGVTVVSLSVALRWRRGGIAPLGPAVLLVAALAFGPDAAESPTALAQIVQVATGLAVLVVCLVWAALRRALLRRSLVRSSANAASEPSAAGAVPERPATVDAASAPTPEPGSRAKNGALRLRSVALVTAILVLASSAAAGAALLVPPATAREVLRDAVEQPFDARDYVSPLSGFRKYWTPPADDEVLFTVEGLPDGAAVRLATMDSYDGVVFSVGGTGAASSGTFVRVPFEIDQTGVEGQQVAVDVTIAGLTGPWLPSVGAPTAVTFDGAGSAALQDSFYFNSASDTGAVTAPLGTGDSYRLTGLLPDGVAESAFAEFTPGTAALPAIGALPEALDLALERYTEDVSGPGNRLVAALEGLRADGYVSHGTAEGTASRSGHAVDRIEQLFTDVPMVGDGEQYAVAAALMARQLGFPARVVMGFIPGQNSQDGTATEVRGADVTAWIEVDTAESGWVTLDPNPEARDIPPETPTEPTTITRPESVVTPPDADPAPASSQDTPESQRDDTGEAEAAPDLLRAVLITVALSLAGILVLLSPFLAIIAIKARKRRTRRRSTDTRARITGGWLEFEDRVMDHGYRPAASATRSEVASLVGGARSVVLAAVTDRAVFAGTEPDPADADQVWKVVRDLTDGLNADVTRWQRLKARVSLASLGGYSGRHPINR
jgi:transglutaminase-like putative cysteine protease